MRNNHRRYITQTACKVCTEPREERHVWDGAAAAGTKGGVFKMSRHSHKRAFHKGYKRGVSHAMKRSRGGTHSGRGGIYLT